MRENIDDLYEVTDKLKSIGIPNTLIHGDFDLLNVAAGIVPEMDFCLFDWSECAISFPFIDYACLRSDWTIGIEKNYEAHEAYLTTWETYESRERIDCATELARLIRMLYTIRRRQLFRENSRLLRNMLTTCEVILIALRKIRTGDLFSKIDKTKSMGIERAKS